MGKSLKDKRFSVVLGFCMLPDGARVMYAGPHFYGKLTYEAAVEVQNLAEKYKDVFAKAMQPMVDELKQLGVLQAEMVAEERKGGGIKVPGVK